MNVYVETNFLLEIALGQEKAAAATALMLANLLELIDVRLPAFSIAEAAAALDRQETSRNVAKQAFEEQRSLLARSSHDNLIDHANHLINGFDAINDTAPLLLKSVLIDFSQKGHLLAIDAVTIQRAADLTQTTNLRLQDALVFASVLVDLERGTAAGPHLFVSRDKKGFDTVEIGRLLRPRNCRYIRSFEAALDFVAARGRP